MKNIILSCTHPDTHTGLELMHNLINQINDNFNEIDVSTLTTDISLLQYNLSNLNNDLSTLIYDVSTLAPNITELNEDISTLTQDIENLDASIISLMSYGYTIFVQGSQTSPTDNQTVYFCSTPQDPVTNELLRAVIVPKTGHIEGCSVIMNTSAGSPGSTEDISTYIRHNRTTDYHIATVSDSSTVRFFQNFNLDISVNQGDIITMKVQYPAFSSNPTQVNWSGNIFLTSPLS
jgi:hypothetical protein